MRVRVVPDGPSDPAPAAGTPVRVEIRDESYTDGAAPVLAAADGTVTADGSSWWAEVTVDAPDPVPDACGFWARVGAGPRTAAGDWITMQSHPVPAGPAAAPDEVTVRVRRVG